MKIKIPSRLKIGGHYVSIFYEDKLMDNHGKYGQSRFAECEIALQDRDMAESSKVQSLLHEILHFIDRAYNNCNMDEATIDAVATGLHAMLVDMEIEIDLSEIRSIKGNNKDKTYASEV